MITLSSPYNPGDADPGQTYAKVLVDSFAVFPVQREIHIRCVYGNGDGASGFMPGKASPVEIVIKDGPVNSHYTEMVANAFPVDIGERLYDGVGRTLYQWLIDNVSMFAGGTVS